MDQIVEALTETQRAELIRRLHDRGGEVRQALLEEAQNVLKDVDSHEVAEECQCAPQWSHPCAGRIGDIMLSVVSCCEN